jgi:hypothetical protein
VKHIDSISIEHHDTRGPVLNIWQKELRGFKGAVSLYHQRRYTKPRTLDVFIDTCRQFAKDEGRRWCPFSDMVKEVTEWSTWIK